MRPAYLTSLLAPPRDVNRTALSSAKTHRRQAKQWDQRRSDSLPNWWKRRNDDCVCSRLAAERTNSKVKLGLYNITFSALLFISEDDSQFTQVVVPPVKTVYDNS